MQLILPVNGQSVREQGVKVILDAFKTWRPESARNRTTWGGLGSFVAVIVAEGEKFS